jgi:hypothetical protein
MHYSPRFQGLPNIWGPKDANPSLTNMMGNVREHIWLPFMVLFPHNREVFPFKVPSPKVPFHRCNLSCRLRLPQPTTEPYST